jgi:hypothetical protein
MENEKKRIREAFANLVNIVIECAKSAHERKDAEAIELVMTATEAILCTLSDDLNGTVLTQAENDHLYMKWASIVDKTEGDLQ